jgi:hypothetical protein
MSRTTAHGADWCVAQGTIGSAATLTPRTTVMTGSVRAAGIGARSFGFGRVWALVLTLAD